MSATHIEFRTDEVVLSTGRPPRGRGSWAFARDRRVDSCSPDIYWSPSCTYGEAKKLARAHFAERFPGESCMTVWVLS